MIEVSEVFLDHDTLEPFISLTYKTKISLDDEIYVTLRMHGERLESLLIDEFRQEIYAKLPGILKKYKKAGYE